MRKQLGHGLRRFFNEKDVKSVLFEHEYRKGRKLKFTHADYYFLSEGCGICPEIRWKDPEGSS